MISQTAEYALRAVLFLGRDIEVAHTTQEIAEATRTPPGYLSKVLQALSKSGVLRSQRGPHGGFVLSKDLRRLSLLEIVNAVDPLRRIARCPLDVEEHASGLCPLHRHIDRALETVERLFGELTVHELLEEECRCKVLSGCGVRSEGGSLSPS